MHLGTQLNFCTCLETNSACSCQSTYTGHKLLNKDFKKGTAQSTSCQAHTCKHAHVATMRLLVPGDMRQGFICRSSLHWLAWAKNQNSNQRKCCLTVLAWFCRRTGSGTRSIQSCKDFYYLPTLIMGSMVQPCWMQTLFLMYVVSFLLRWHTGRVYSLQRCHVSPALAHTRHDVYV